MAHDTRPEAPHPATHPDLVETLPQIVFTADAAGRVSYYNQRWYEYTGLDVEESRPGRGQSALHPKDRDRTMRRWERACAEGTPFETEYRLYSRSLGTYRWFLARAVPVRDDSGAIVSWSGTCTDIDDQKQLEDQVRRHAAELKVSRADLAKQARHDGLTGLANRHLFEERLRQSVAVAERNGRALAVLFIDLDGFKQVNDSLGHAAGDELLKQVADRLSSRLRTGDTVARLGGDEFVAVAPELDDPNDAGALVRKLVAELGEPYEIADQRVRVTVSIGVSLYPQDAREPEALLRHADVAMYRAKRAGKNNARFFAPDMQAAAQERLAIAAHLDGAVQRGEIALHFQPQLHVATGTVRSFEALMRWTSPTLGTVEPSRFIPVADDLGMAIDLAAWAVDHACGRVRRWSRLAGRPLSVAVNVALDQLDREDFVPMVAGALERHHLEPGQLELELAVRSASRDAEPVGPVLAELKRLGVRLILDDFGTEHAALTHLLRLPLDGLKVDQSVVADRDGTAAGPAGARRVLQALVSLATALDLEVIGDGIETPEQRAIVVDVGCTRLQGYHLGRPRSAGDVEHLLAPAPTSPTASTASAWE